MKLKLLMCGLLFGAPAVSPLFAQDYQHLTISSGLNEDVIANGANTAAGSTTTIVDNDSFAFVAADFQPTGSSVPPAYGLPVNGIITSAATPGLTYSLADYSSNNSLRIHGTTPAPAVTTGTLVFSNQVNAKKLYMLATSGSGASTVTVVVNFADATSQTFTGIVLPDWFNSTAQPIAASGFGRVSVATDNVENPSNNPRLYQIQLNIDTANQTKLVESIDITKTSTAAGVANIFAISADVLGTCPAPEALTAVSGVDTGTVSWDAAIIVPGEGYDYYLSTTNTAPTAATEPTGNVDNATTSVSFEDLTIGQTYYVWVRSNCSESDQGPWVMASFTTGQISVTYNGGEIQTLYNSGPNTGSATTCPGTLTVAVPDGYQVAATAVSYTMTTASNGWMSEQRSLLVSTGNNTTEASVSSGAGNSGGTMNYNRTGLTIANGLTGNVGYELRAWRTYGGSGCNTTWNKVDNNSWKVTVTYECVTPDTPAAEAEQTLCPGSTVADIMAETSYENAVLRVYDAETGGEPLEATTELVSGTTYYVSQYRYTCESDRQAVVVTVGLPAAPTAGSQQYCDGATVSSLEADGIATAELHWYATADATESLDAEDELETGSYFVSQSVGECEGERTEVAVTVISLDEPNAEEEQSVCNGATVADLMATAEDGAALHWYATGDAPDALTPETALASGSYFVSQTLEGCESDREEVIVTVISLGAPTASAQTVCAGTTLEELSADIEENAELHWYAGADTPGPLSDEALVQNGSYFASQSVEGCESERVEVVVNVTVVPGPAVTAQVFCAGATAADLMATPTEGADLRWYATADISEELGEELVLESGNYFVSQSAEGCESERIEVAVTVNALPDAPAGNTEQFFVEGDLIGSLEVTFAEGAEGQWFVMNEAMELVPVEPTEALVDGETYYISQSVNDCESEYLAVTASIDLATQTFGIKGLQVYPNPADNVVNLSANGVIANATLSNLLGQTVMVKQNNANSMQMDISALAAGTYVLSIRSAEGASASVKIVKQ